MCALNRIFGYAPRIASALLDCFGSAAPVFRMGKDELREVLGPGSKYAAEICARSLDMAAAELEEAGRMGVEFRGRGEAGYPALLAECEDAPAGLYVRSDAPSACLAAERDCIAIVGTRDITPYGKEWCTRIVDALAGTGKNPVIVSGLAYGTDITAHRTALENGLDTIAVMATGADTVYPPAHRGDAMKIAGKAGSALITDYPLHTKAIAINFIRRNRIIAGMCRATILIESRSKGGGMITASQAFSYNRDVFALPGRAGDPFSAGCNSLIRSGCAAPVTSERDLVESLGFIFRKESGKHAVPSEYYSGDMDKDSVGMMSRILLLIRKNRRMSLDELAEATALPYGTVAELCGILETDGFISIDLMQRCTINRKK